ncbi:EAL domain-containing protein [Methylobacterium sp. NEAU K]|uniref:EAL domain-containing protein n=1 Tax=Methylobacterium sp. NEAU K TaxID=3064946 RepID=UPI0027353D97|nr:EAL domain-containing protein [Methylobacterium sp. NEAU K]MDP4006928.1 EAL domain-containing protein [Methylobacterium sp. NEAU K]
MTVHPVRVRKPRTASARSPSILHRSGAYVRAAFQPIENLQTGQIVGFEALARLALDDRLLSPAAFLPELSQEDLAVLFNEMLGQAVALRRTLPHGGAGLYVTVNVEAPLVLSDGFLGLLRRNFDSNGYAADGSLVLELLERHETADIARMSERLSRVRSMGVAVALDDIGSAYSSLTTLRDLPVDIMKLDQSFARGLALRPRDLTFVFSLQGLARSIGKQLVVEGVETPEIYDALRVLGVDLAQGYAIARPMPAEAVPGWLSARLPGKLEQGPCTLLGAYAGHLRVVEACRILMGQRLPMAWKEAAKDPHACSIGTFFDRLGVHDTAFGQAHKRFHEVMALYDAEPGRWQTGADDFRRELEEALADPSSRFHCEAVAA